MRLFIYGFVAIGLWFACSARADVYRCENPEQGIVFQQTPCPEPEAEAASDPEGEPASEASAPGDETESVSAPQGRATVRRGEDVADVLAAEQERQQQNAAVKACKQQYRDAIDAIDLEIRNSYTPEQRDYYLERLKALTDQMGAC